MGGNAFKDQETTRLNSYDYGIVTGTFNYVFQECLGFDPTLIKAYHNKSSFGDADFLIDSSKLPENWTRILQDRFDLSDKQYKKNGNVVSIVYNSFQIDLIVTAHEDMEFSDFYFGYNDFGNLIGRIGHKLGIKIGHKGLSIVVRHHSNHILDEIYLSKNPEDALNILGLSKDVYDKGFDNLEDIFKYVASSKYFDPAIYALEHRSNTSRIRDKKRPTYNKFLKWVDEVKPKSNHNFKEKSELGGYSIRLPYYNTEVLTRWPEIEVKVNEVMKIFELHQEFSKVYNGDIVAYHTGYSGKTLGAFMSKMKPSITEEIKQHWIKDPTLVGMNITKLWMELGGIQFNVDKQ